MRNATRRGPLTKALVITTALFTVGLTACATDSAPAPAAAGGPYPVVFTAGAKTVTDWDHFIAVDQGFYKKYAVELDEVSTETAGAATQLLVTGDAQVGRGLPPMIQAVAGSNGGVKLLDVGDLLIRPPHELHAAPGIKSFKDLVGKNVGTSSPTDSATIVTRDVLRRLDIDASKVNIVAAGGTAARLSGLESGALDATLLLPPVNFTATDQGYPAAGYVPKVLGPDYYFAFSSVIVNPNWASKNENALVAFLKARGEALRFLADPANKAEAIRILAKDTKIEESVAEQTYDLLGIGTKLSAFNSDIGVHQGAAGEVLDALQAFDQAPADLKLDTLVDDSYAAKARG